MQTIIETELLVRHVSIMDWFCISGKSKKECVRKNERTGVRRERERERKRVMEWVLYHGKVCNKYKFIVTIKNDINWNCEFVIILNEWRNERESVHVWKKIRKIEKKYKCESDKTMIWDKNIPLRWSRVLVNKYHDHMQFVNQYLFFSWATDVKTCKEINH